jgi:FixJ family two-component response regulator
MLNVAARRVFFVDDDSAVRAVVARILREVAIKVDCFDDPATCLAELRSQRCNLLITDLKMPEMDGIELLTNVKRLAPWLPILVVTAYGDIPIAVKAIRVGAVDFIEKPLNKKSFVDKVESILRGTSNYERLGEPLTETERTVLRLVMEGKTSKEIARSLNRSCRTIEGHRTHIMHKLGADSLVDLLERAAAMGLID